MNVRGLSTLTAGALLSMALLGLAGCAQNSLEGLQPLQSGRTGGVDYDYVIGPGDTLDIFVWRNPDVSVKNVPVRPDGKISSPLVEDLVAAGKTSNRLAREIEAILAKYIQDPLVSVTVVGFVGGYSEQVRVVGEAAKPTALPYRKGMTVLDVMIEVGGLTEFAAGNNAKIIRNVNDQARQIKVRLADLIQDGDIGANIEMLPGDILLIPESLF